MTKSHETPADLHAPDPAPAQGLAESPEDAWGYESALPYLQGAAVGAQQPAGDDLPYSAWR